MSINKYGGTTRVILNSDTLHVARNKSFCYVDVDGQSKYYTG
jgi:hypothetical protein